jgi:hypothetical protein
MWQSGAATATTRYRFDLSGEWQPLINLRRMLEAVPASSNPSATNTSSNQNLVLPIVSLVLAFIPLICIAGVICAHKALGRVRATNDATARIISIIALVVGYLSLIHTALVLVGGSVVLLNSYSEPPDFTQ